MIFKNILLAYQLENYKNIRFLKFIYSHPKFSLIGSKRQVLDLTLKAKFILIFAILLFIWELIWIAYLWTFSWVYYIFFPFCFFLLPLSFIVANICLYPIDTYLKNRIISQAKKKIASFPHLKVIAITWSYGKTTTKEILKTTLSPSFNVLATEGTKNTPLGISRLILDELNTSHEIFIVEMWAYTKWNIKELCNIVHPNISIITGITLQHLERFKSLDNIIDTKFEILECLWKNDFAVVDMSTEWVQKWLKEKLLQVKNIIQIDTDIPYTYKENLLWICFQIAGKTIETKLLWAYVRNTFSICYEVWKYLGQDISDFEKWVSQVEFVEHRMQLIYNPQSDVFVLDDSFNWNLEWIWAIFDLMRHAPFYGRKILVAGWIVELGWETEIIHKKLWKNISELADLVLLVEWPVWNALELWLHEHSYPQEKIQKYPSALMLHEDIKNIIKKGDLIIFQNDLPDHYL